MNLQYNSDTIDVQSVAFTPLGEMRWNSVNFFSNLH